MEETDIRKWVKNNAYSLMPKTDFSSEDFDHIAMCLHHIYLWYFEAHPIGGFLTAIVRNDFNEACFRADDINRKALYLYALFLANKIPLDYKRKALAEVKGR